MKNIVIIILFMAAAGFVQAQHVVLQTGAEQTVAGVEYGGYLQYETKRLWGMGLFYQVGYNRANTEGGFQMKDPFYGMVLQAPVMQCSKMALLVNLRTGLVNEKFLAVVPGVDTRLQLTKRFGVVVGTSFRKGYPAFSGKLLLKLGNN